MPMTASFKAGTESSRLRIPRKIVRVRGDQQYILAVGTGSPRPLSKPPGALRYGTVC